MMPHALSKLTTPRSITVMAAAVSIAVLASLSCAPKGQVQSSRSKTAAVLAIGLALLGLSTLGAFVISRHVRRGLLAAAEAAETMSRGERPQTFTSNVKEVAQLGRALQHSAAPGPDPANRREAAPRFAQGKAQNLALNR